MKTSNIEFEKSNGGISYKHCTKCGIKEEGTVMSKTNEGWFCCDCYSPIEQARKTLKEAGYSVENLWHINDVKGLFNCTDLEAEHVLYNALKNEATFDQIWFAIKSHAENEGLEKISK